MTGATGSAISTPGSPGGLRRFAPYGLKISALALVYGGAAIFSLTWSVAPGAGSPIWPGSGIALAALILGGLRLWPGIVLGRLLAAIVLNSPQPCWADILLAGCTALGAVVPAWSARRLHAFDASLSTLSQMLWLIVAAVASAVSSAIPAMAVLWLSGTPAGHLSAIFLNWTLGNVCGVLAFAPPLLAWSLRDAWKMSPREWSHLAACLGVVGAAGFMVFLHPPFARMPTWYLFPVLIWSALAFSVRGAGLALVITAMLAVWSAVAGVGPLASVAPDTSGRLLLSQQFVAITAVTMLLLAAVADERRGRQRILESEGRLLEERRALETLNATGASIAAELDLDAVVQTVTDAGVALTGARFGAFFYNLADPEGETYTLFTVSGAPRSAFERFGIPRSTEVFAPTFKGAGGVRSADITADPRYGRNAPHTGMPPGHLPVRSYLAVPVKSRSGEVIGSLFFGHPDADVFTERAEWIVSGIAAQAAIALDNARLYQAAQAEIAERRRVEERQELLINELNHRVKNTLATVQSITAQTLRPLGDAGQAKEALTARIIALARAHDVITARNWQGADLRDVVVRAAEPFEAGAPRGGARFHLEGPPVWLSPRVALAISMALHELGTNAAKYGALSAPAGTVSISWFWDETKRSLRLVWTEQGGPQVSPPATRGFGSRMIERGLKTDLNGRARLVFAPGGLICEITAQLDPTAAGSYLEVG